FHSAEAIGEGFRRFSRTPYPTGDEQLGPLEAVAGARWSHVNRRLWLQPGEGLLQCGPRLRREETVGGNQITGAAFQQDADALPFEGDLLEVVDFRYHRQAADGQGVQGPEDVGWQDETGRAGAVVPQLRQVAAGKPVAHDEAEA